MWVVSAVSLAVVMLLCVLGVFLPRRCYHGNLAQCLGMIGVFMFSWPKFASLVVHQHITSVVMPVSAQIAGHVGLALYALGTAYVEWRRTASTDAVEPAPVAPLL